MTSRQEHKELIEILKKNLENRSLCNVIMDLREAALLVLGDDPCLEYVDEILCEAEDVARVKII